MRIDSLRDQKIHCMGFERTGRCRVLGRSFTTLDYFPIIIEFTRINLSLPPSYPLDHRFYVADPAVPCGRWLVYSLSKIADPATRQPLAGVTKSRSNTDLHLAPSVLVPTTNGPSEAKACSEWDPFVAENRTP
ncbi:hypothetical protein TNCV_311221 [Trichonephila clavipes]|nr:hypothetical protein TNCV_311221 [Trichonephila clavipes]